MTPEQILKKANKHYLKHRSSFIVVVLRSARHGACVCCGKRFESSDPIEESAEHWRKALKEDAREISPVLPGMEKFLEGK